MSFCLQSCAPTALKAYFYWPELVNTLWGFFLFFLWLDGSELNYGTKQHVVACFYLDNINDGI